MTYCVGMMLDRGLVLMSDTRTNSGVDNISTFRKMHHWEVADERIVTLMSSGNLATTQAVVSQLEERNKAPSERHNSLLEAPTMFQVATMVGKLLNDTIELQNAESGEVSAGKFTASMIVAGQIKGMQPRMFLVYPEGNFIEASFDTPFFQIGETKYGRPIILRGYDRAMSFEDAVKLLMVSFEFDTQGQSFCRPAARHAGDRARPLHPAARAPGDRGRSLFPRHLDRLGGATEEGIPVAA